MKLTRVTIGMDGVDSYIEFEGYNDSNVRKKLLLIKQLCKSFSFRSISYYDRFDYYHEYKIFFNPYWRNIRKIRDIIGTFK